MAVLLQSPLATGSTAAWAANQDVAAGSVDTDDTAAGASQATSVRTGDATGGASGSITVQTGTSNNASTGLIDIVTGANTAANQTTGVASLASGAGTDAASGAVEVLSGDATSVTGIRPSGGVNVYSGSSTANGNAGGISGNVSILSGDTDNLTAHAGGASGTVIIASGSTDSSAGAVAGGASGAITLASGNTDASFAGAATAGASGAVTVKSGDTDVQNAASTAANSGNVLIQSGDTSDTGASGTSGNSGSVTVESGTAEAGLTGNVVIQTGNSTAGGSGDVVLNTGNNAPATSRGLITIPTGSPSQLQNFNRLSPRYELKWVAGERGKPGVVGDIVTAAEATRMIADPNFMIVGVSGGGAQVRTNTTYYAEGGVLLSTGGNAADTTILAPETTANITPWAQVTWGTDQETRWECLIEATTEVGVDGQIYHAGLKLTNTNVASVDNDEVYFRYEGSVIAGDWQAIHDVGGLAPVLTDTNVPVAANTVYHLVISILPDRTALMYINGILVDTTAALTNAVNLIPFIGVTEAGVGANVETLRVYGQTISRTYGA